ncbi:MAG: flagellar biosynthesis anti-sigma factor FlgM [Oscillospiraceae bacterium]|nr:flagellar biosynthesis anti-sigma factor FlgM [Oscillospiraceae bacterium]
MDIRRINQNTAPNLYGNVNNKENTQAVEKKADVAKTEIKNNINISEKAKNLSALDFAKSKIKSELNKEISEVPIEKVNNLKEQIKSGTYNVDSKDIAASILTGKKV